MLQLILSTTAPPASGPQGSTGYLADHDALLGGQVIDLANFELVPFVEAQ